MNLEPLKKYNGKYVIYYLYLDGELQYIGQTKCLFRRIQTHAQSKAFDDIGIADHDERAKMFNNEERKQYMDFCETAEILKRRPKLNKKQLSDNVFLNLFYSLRPSLQKDIIDRMPSLGIA